MSWLSNVNINSIPDAHPIQMSSNLQKTLSDPWNVRLNDPQSLRCFGSIVAKYGDDALSKITSLEILDDLLAAEKVSVDIENQIQNEVNGFCSADTTCVRTPLATKTNNKGKGGSSEEGAKSSALASYIRKCPSIRETELYQRINRTPETWDSLASMCFDPIKNDKKVLVTPLIICAVYGYKRIAKMIIDRPLVAINNFSCEQREWYISKSETMNDIKVPLELKDVNGMDALTASLLAGQFEFSEMLLNSVNEPFELVCNRTIDVALRSMAPLKLIRHLLLLYTIRTSRLCCAEDIKTVNVLRDLIKNEIYSQGHHTITNESEERMQKYSEWLEYKQGPSSTLNDETSTSASDTMVTPPMQKVTMGTDAHIEVYAWDTIPDFEVENSEESLQRYLKYVDDIFALSDECASKQKDIAFVSDWLRTFHEQMADDKVWQFCFASYVYPQLSSLRGDFSRQRKSYIDNENHFEDQPVSCLLPLHTLIEIETHETRAYVCQMIREVLRSSAAIWHENSALHLANTDEASPLSKNNDSVSAANNIKSDVNDIYEVASDTDNDENENEHKHETDNDDDDEQIDETTVEDEEEEEEIEVCNAEEEEEEDRGNEEDNWSIRSSIYERLSHVPSQIPILHAGVKECVIQLSPKTDDEMLSALESQYATNKPHAFESDIYPDGYQYNCDGWTKKPYLTWHIFQKNLQSYQSNEKFMQNDGIDRLSYPTMLWLKYANIEMISCRSLSIFRKLIWGKYVHETDMMESDGDIGDEVAKQQNPDLTKIHLQMRPLEYAIFLQKWNAAAELFPQYSEIIRLTCGFGWVEMLLDFIINYLLPHRAFPLIFVIFSTFPELFQEGNEIILLTLKCMFLQSSDEFKYLVCSLTNIALLKKQTFITPAMYELEKMQPTNHASLAVLRCHTLQHGMTDWLVGGESST